MVAQNDLKGAKKVLDSAKHLKCALWDFERNYTWLLDYIEHHQRYPAPPPVNEKISCFQDIWPFVNSIFKHLKKEEAEVLFNFACNGSGKSKIVEIGSECGRSTVVLGWGSKMRKREKVCSIDSHILYPFYRQYLNNIHLAGLDDYVISHIGYSNQIAKTWPGEDIRLLFIDGDHRVSLSTGGFRNVVPFSLPWRNNYFP